jgi:hypothetical protein
MRIPIHIQLLKIMRNRNPDHNNNACVVRRKDTGTCLGEYWKLLAEEVDLVQQQVNRGALQARAVSP